jgi:hypothetical protein
LLGPDDPAMSIIDALGEFVDPRTQAANIRHSGTM